MAPYTIRYGTSTSAACSHYDNDAYTWETWPSITSAASDSDSYTFNNCKSIKWYNKESDWGTNTSGTICYEYEDCTTTGSPWVQLYPRPVAPLDPQARLREIISARQGPAIHVRPSKYYNPADEREIRARETLRRVIGEQNYRYFLRTGFINARGKSGILYRICRGHMVDAWKNGEHIERLCVYLKGDFTPADELITKFLMILNNEDQFRAIANISKGRSAAARMTDHLPIGGIADQRPLPDILRELKAA